MQDWDDFYSLCPSISKQGKIRENHEGESLSSSFLTSLWSWLPALARSSSGVSATVVNLEMRSSWPLLYSTYGETVEASHTQKPLQVFTSITGTRDNPVANLSGWLQGLILLEVWKSARHCWTLTNMNSRHLQNINRTTPLYKWTPRE